jgi:type IV pilus assembly protein PilW
MKRLLARPRVGHHIESGFSLLEMLISITIGVFLLAGLMLVFSNTRQNYSVQTGLSQLQDNERLAMSVLTTVIEHAGYYAAPIPSPGNQIPMVVSRSAAFFADSSDGFSTAGQSVTGTAAGGAFPSASTTASTDAISVRYLASVKDATYQDSLQSCSGSTNSSTTSAQMFVNTFTVDTTLNALMCVVGAVTTVTNGGTTTSTSPIATALSSHDTSAALVNGVSNLQIVYGVDTTGDGSIDTYFTTGGMSASNWANVHSVMVTLTFSFPNPLGGATPSTINFSRIIYLPST